MDKVRVRATAAVGVAWVLGVWARGLALVDDAFVLEVVGENAHGTAVEVMAVRWEEGQAGAWSPRVRPGRVMRDEGGERSLVWSEQA